MTNTTHQDAINLIKEKAGKEGLEQEVLESFEDAVSFLKKQGLPIDYRREAFYALWDWDIA